RRAPITRAQVGPGAAAVVGLAGRLAGESCRVLQLDAFVVPAPAADGEFPRAAFRLDDARTAHPRHAAGLHDSRRHLGLEPADRGAIAGRIAEGPGAATRLALTAQRADGGVAGPNGKAGVVGARAVEADLRPGRRGHEH